MQIRTRRLVTGDRDVARSLFELMARVFEETCDPLSDEYVDSLLARDDFWVIAALDSDEIVGGITAHTLPMTRTESHEIFIYDLAVRADRQRSGIGRMLVSRLQQSAGDRGIRVLFVPADNEDTHALDFYRAIGASASPVTFFTLSS